MEANADCSLACVDQDASGVIDQAEVIAVITCIPVWRPAADARPGKGPYSRPHVHAVSNLHAESHLGSSPDPNASVHDHAGSYPGSRR